MNAFVSGNDYKRYIFCYAGEGACTAFTENGKAGECKLFIMLERGKPPPQIPPL